MRGTNTNNKLREGGKKQSDREIEKRRESIYFREKRK
jgi:hypothetical protein